MIPLKDENPSHSFAFMTLLIILSNILVFGYQFMNIIEGNDITTLFAMKPYTLLHNPGLDTFKTIITSMFLHGGLLHLIGNMWFLWIFGNNIEDRLGHFNYVLFYLLTGICAALVHVFTNPGSNIPTIGASGAVSGILGAYILLFPHARIITLIPIFFIMHITKIPAFFFLGIWFLFQFIGGTSQGLNTTGGIAWFAHIGGFIAGMIFIVLFPKHKPRHREEW